MSSEYDSFEAMKDLFTFAIALFGAGLGVLNYWRAHTRDVVRLKVIPKRYYAMPQGPNGLCVDVINIGFLPVTISSVRIKIDGKDELTLLHDFKTGNPIARRLDSRAAFTAYFSPDTLHEERLREAKHVVVITACECRFTGTSSAFRSYIAEARTT